MQTTILNDKLVNFFKLFLKYLSYLMVAVYLVLASLLLFTKLYATVLLPFQRYAFGGILFAYGLYRCYRVYKEQNTRSDEN